MVSRTWYAQRSFLRKVYNRDVNNYFKDVPQTDDNLGISSTRQEVKSACLIRPKDSQNMALIKMLTFYNVVQQLPYTPQFFGLPIQTFIDTQRNKAQIIIQFREKRSDAGENNRIPATAQVSFRIEETSWTQSKVQQWANTIKSAFATPRFSWKKGRTLYNYWDPAGGWNFQLRANSETEAKSVIEKCFSAKGAGSPDYEEFLKEQKDNRNYGVAETVTIMGETKKKPKLRPIATVYFAWAELVIPGYGENIILVDVTGTKAKAIEYA